MLLFISISEFMGLFILFTTIPVHKCWNCIAFLIIFLTQQLLRRAQYCDLVDSSTWQMWRVLNTTSEHWPLTNHCIPAYNSPKMWRSEFFSKTSNAYRIAEVNSVSKSAASIFKWMTQCSLIRAPEKCVNHTFIEEVGLEWWEQNLLQLFFATTAYHIC